MSSDYGGLGIAPDCACPGQSSRPNDTREDAPCADAATADRSALGGGTAEIRGISLTAFAPGGAEEFLGGAPAALAGCTTETRSEQGTTIRVTARAERTDRFGDESFAFSLTTRAGTQVFVHAVVVARVGSTVVRSTHVNLTGDTVVMPEVELVRAQVARVQAVTRGRPAAARS